MHYTYSRRTATFVGFVALVAKRMVYYFVYILVGEVLILIVYIG